MPLRQFREGRELPRPPRPRSGATAHQRRGAQQRSHHLGLFFSKAGSVSLYPESRSRLAQRSALGACQVLAPTQAVLSAVPPRVVTGRLCGLSPPVQQSGLTAGPAGPCFPAQAQPRAALQGSSRPSLGRPPYFQLRAYATPVRKARLSSGNTDQYGSRIVLGHHGVLHAYDADG